MLTRPVFLVRSMRSQSTLSSDRGLSSGGKTASIGHEDRRMGPTRWLFLLAFLVMQTLGSGCGAGTALESSGGDAGPGISQGVGGLCDLMADAGPTQAVYNAQALQCPSRICIKPRDQAGGVDTAPFCSALCQTDSDCNGVLRSPDNPSDRHCATGFTCGVAFVIGPLCCKPMCLCKDFLASGTATIPQQCLQDGQVRCPDYQ
jgi:hypothetical protein